MFLLRLSDHFGVQNPFIRYELKLSLPPHQNEITLAGCLSEFRKKTVGVSENSSNLDSAESDWSMSYLTPELLLLSRYYQSFIRLFPNIIISPKYYQFFIFLIHVKTASPKFRATDVKSRLIL